MSKLILLSLPIGNLDDISNRAKIALARGKCFFAEDTRTFKSFLMSIGISLTDKQIISFHDNIDRSKKLVGLLRSGEDVYVVSEAGSPIISDPAYPLVKKALSEGIEVDSIPGVCSVILALELSGLPPQPFCFHGFVPRENQQTFFKSLGQGTHIFFESPVRCENTLITLSSLFPDDQIAVGRELSKKFQTVHRFLGKDFSNQTIIYKGEFVILLNIPSPPRPFNLDRVSKFCSDYIQGKGGKKLLAKIFAEILNEDTKKIYQNLTRID